MRKILRNRRSFGWSPCTTTATTDADGRALTLTASARRDHVVITSTVGTEKHDRAGVVGN